MQDPVVIDKKTYKVMRYIYRHHEISLNKIGEKFGEDGIASALYLCPKHLAAYRDNAGILTFDITHTSSDGLIGLTVPGNKYIEDRSSSFIKWCIPTLISILALITSVAALIASMSNELTIHLIQ